MPVVARLDQYSATLAREFDEVSLNSMKVTGIGTYYSQGFNENVGIANTLTANVFRPYDVLNDLVAEVPYGVGIGTYMRQNNNKTVDVYDEIDEVTLYGSYTKNGLVLNLDAGSTASYSGIGTLNAWKDLSPTQTTATLAKSAGALYPSFSTDNFGGFDVNTSQYIQINNSVLPSTTSFTISLILKFNSLSGTKYLFDNRDSGTSGFLLKTSSQSIAFDLNTTSIVTPITVSTGQIYFVDLVVDGSSGTNTKTTPYLNSIPSTTQTFSPLINFNTTIFPRIGSVSYSSAPIITSAFGIIYSAKLYNRALSRSEIYQNFNILKEIYNL